MPQKKAKRTRRKGSRVALGCGGYLCKMCLVEVIAFQRSFLYDIQGSKIFMTDH